MDGDEIVNSDFDAFARTIVSCLRFGAVEEAEE